MGISDRSLKFKFPSIQFRNRPDWQVGRAVEAGGTAVGLKNFEGGMSLGANQNE
jgi:hypothetical protein